MRNVKEYLGNPNKEYGVCKVRRGRDKWKGSNFLVRWPCQSWAEIQSFWDISISIIRAWRDVTCAPYWRGWLSANILSLLITTLVSSCRQILYCRSSSSLLMALAHMYDNPYSWSILCMCCLFNDAVSISDYVVYWQDDWWIMNYN
jgi:hypothetical protein